MLVSVIIPTYNRSGKVFRALDSVLHQSYKDLEVILVDDGSTDDTAQWMECVGDPRVRYFYCDHKGVAAARNFGVQKARAEWVCFLDSDDVWRRHKLSEQLRFHAANRGVLISQTDDVWIRNSVRVNKMKKHEVRTGDIFEQSLRLCLICCSSVMVQKKLFEELGGFDESLETCEDYDLWLRVLSQHRVEFVKKKLVTKFGGHEDQLSKKFSIMDAYRVQSLQKILNSGVLNDKQCELVQKELIYKRNIIQKGARKR